MTAWRQAIELSIGDEDVARLVTIITRSRTEAASRVERARLPRQAGARHGVQDTQRARGKAAQGPLLPGTPRSRIQSQDGGGSVHLPRGEDHQGDRGGSEAKAKRCSGDRFL